MVSVPKNEAFRKARLKKGLKAVELAFAAGCSVPTIYNVENGRCQTTLGLARRLAAALDTTVDAIFPETSSQRSGAGAAA
jgi:DNA-binding XRE family transcriptional regulator